MATLKQPPAYSGIIDDRPFELHIVSRSQLPRRHWGLTIVPSREAEPYRCLVRRDLSRRNIVATIIHEILHVADYAKDEWWVDVTATQITRALLAVENDAPT